jgi:hypothetical protein
MHEITSVILAMKRGSHGAIVSVFIELVNIIVGGRSVLVLCNNWDDWHKPNMGRTSWSC